jgi:hypothetical protein
MGNVVENTDIVKEVDKEDWGSGRERCDNIGEREIVYWVEEFVG